MLKICPFLNLGDAGDKACPGRESPGTNPTHLKIEYEFAPLVFGSFPLVLYKFKKMNSKFCFLPNSTDDKTLLLPGMDLETGTCHLTGALTTMRWNGNGETTSKTVLQDSETPFQPCRSVHTTHSKSYCVLS